MTEASYLLDIKGHYKQDSLFLYDTIGWFDWDSGVA